MRTRGVGVEKLADPEIKRNPALTGGGRRDRMRNPSAGTLGLGAGGQTNHGKGRVQFLLAACPASGQRRRPDMRRRPRHSHPFDELFAFLLVAFLLVGLAGALANPA